MLVQATRHFDDGMTHNSRGPLDPHVLSDLRGKTSSSPLMASWLLPIHRPMRLSALTLWGERQKCIAHRRQSSAEERATARAQSRGSEGQTATVFSVLLRLSLFSRLRTLRTRLSNHRIVGTWRRLTADNRCVTGDARIVLTGFCF